MKLLRPLSRGVAAAVFFMLVGGIQAGDQPVQTLESPACQHPQSQSAPWHHSPRMRKPVPVVFYKMGQKPPDLKQKNARPERLVQGANMKSVALVNYSIQLIIDTEKDILRSTSGQSDDGQWSSKSSSGSDRYIPRITITARNNPLPKSALLVIEYFSRNIADKSKSRRECVEHIALPEIAKGQSLTLDARGVEFFSWEHQSGTTFGRGCKHSGGLELYGLIISIFAEDEVLMQMCTSQALKKECANVIPPPQAYEDSKARHYYGW